MALPGDMLSLFVTMQARRVASTLKAVMLLFRIPFGIVFHYRSRGASISRIMRMKSCSALAEN